MRRNWLTILLFALAMAIQLVAPVLVNVALAGGASSPGAAADGGLCLRSFDASDRSLPAPDHLKGHRDACLLCQIHCDGAVPWGARAASFGRAPVYWTALPWTAADRALPTPASDYSRQARAPPFFS